MAYFEGVSWWTAWKLFFDFFLKEFLKEMLGGDYPPGFEDFPPRDPPPQR